jgi:hypothetical protein
MIVAVPFLLVSSACYFGARHALLVSLANGTGLARTMDIDRPRTAPIEEVA